MLTQLSLHAGATSSTPSLVFAPGAVTVFIGPNNSGKSQALKDIAALIGQPKDRQCVVAGLEFPAFSQASDLLEQLRAVAYEDDGYRLACMRSLPARGKMELSVDDVQASYANPDWVQQILGSALTIWLDGQTRLGLLGDDKLGDLLGPPLNHLTLLFRNDEARLELRAAVLDAFNEYLVLDPTNVGNVRVRLSKRPPDDSAEEQGLDARARDFHSAASLISMYSDGVRAYSGLLAAVLSSRHRLMLIDEPEAFLHPTLARTLGHRLALLAKARSANVIAATHSSEFLMGCVESGVPIQVVRLTYGQEVGTARLLPAQELRKLMRDPLLRSASVLGGLFHAGVCVSESDTDRAFYQEINYRLLAAADEGSKSTLFLNAQNKQTVCRIIGPLRRLGVPAAAVVDIDVLKEGGKNWTQLLSAANVPQALHAGWGDVRSKLKAAFNAASKDMKKDGGLAALPPGDAEAGKQLFASLAEYGIFVVGGGELESWLRHLSVPGKGAPWLVAMFDAMKQAPGDHGYVYPADGDVWGFLRAIARWIAEPDRKGVN